MKNIILAALGTIATKDAVVENEAKFSSKYVDDIKPETFEFKEIEETPKPMCEKTFCKSRSQGKYKVITNEGMVEWQGNLCISHWARAKREGDVHEI